MSKITDRNDYDCYSEETWRSVNEEGFSNRYLVSDMGRVFALPHNRVGAEGVDRMYGGKVMVQHLTKAGYMRVSLHSDEGVKKNFFTHRLIYDAFHPGTLNIKKTQTNELFCEVDHIDNDHSMNHLENLQCLTSRLNLEKALGDKTSHWWMHKESNQGGNQCKSFYLWEQGKKEETEELCIGIRYTANRLGLSEKGLTAVLNGRSCTTKDKKRVKYEAETVGLVDRPLYYTSVQTVAA